MQLQRQAQEDMAPRAGAVLPGSRCAFCVERSRRARRRARIRHSAIAFTRLPQASRRGEDAPSLHSVEPSLRGRFMPRSIAGVPRFDPACVCRAAAIPRRKRNRLRTRFGSPVLCRAVSLSRSIADSCQCPRPRPCGSPLFFSPLFLSLFWPGAESFPCDPCLPPWPCGLCPCGAYWALPCGCCIW
jgi:hypothetical protein